MNMRSSQQSRHRRFLRAEAERHQRVLEVAKVVSTTLGGDFLRSTVQHLAGALGVDCVFVAELTGGPHQRSRTVAVYRDNALATNFEEDLRGTGSFQVLTDGSVSLSADAGRIFPLDPLLAEMEAEGYVGLRLSDSNGQVIGLIAVVNRNRLEDLALVNSVLQTFALRAAAELERKRAYEATRESEERYRAFVSSSMDAMWRIEFGTPIPLNLPENEQIERIYEHGYIAECNPAMAGLVGAKTAGELVGTLFVDLFPRTDDRVYQELLSFVRSGYNAATVLTMPFDTDGNRLYKLRTQCGIVDNDHLLRIWGTTRDITQLKRAELAVGDTERRFRQVLETVQLPVLMVDLAGAVTFCNDYLVHLTGVPKNELTGRSWLDFIAARCERDRWKCLLSKRARPERDERIDCAIKSRDGVSRLVAWDTVGLRNENGDLTGLGAIGRDYGVVAAERM